MKTYDELKTLIEQRGVHAEFGEPGEGFGIEQNPHELATFLVRMQELGVASCLEIGTGYKAGLSRFLAQDMGWQVTSIDVNNYHHVFEGVHYIVGKGRYLAGTLADRPRFDLVFIDGDHSFDAVLYDYAYYGKTFAGKVIAFHDIAGLRGCEGVRQVWEILSNRLIHVTSVYAPNRVAGIGWIEL